jgi:ATP-binding cassette subfamily F protein 3
LGANGQGKSTLVKTIARTMPLLSGTLTEGKGLNIGYFAQQELDVLSLDDHPLQHMIRLARDAERSGTLSGQSTREQDLRNFLGRFQFSGDMVMQAVGSMSGGEKARLVLCMLVWQRPNLLLLDEPTNHLDLATREALAIALNEFEGSVLLVSHDRALLRTVCDEFWLVAQGAVSPFDGDLDDYQRYLLDQAKVQRQALAAAAKQGSAAPQPASAPVTSKAIDAPKMTPVADNTVNPAEQRKQQAAKRQLMAEQLKPFKQEANTIEKRLAQLQQEQAALHEQMMRPTTPPELAEAGRRLKTVDDTIEQLEARWMELLEHIEQLEGASA